MITRINAASKMWIKLLNLINNLKKSNIELDRKTLSLLAYNDFEAFEKLFKNLQLIAIKI